MSIKNIYRYLLVGGVLVGLTLSTVSVELTAQSIDSLLSIALRTHPGFERLSIASERAEVRADGAGAWEAPKVGLQFQMLPPLNPNPVTKGETMIMVEQAIPLGGQKQAMAKAEQRMVELVEPHSASLRRRLRAEIEREYYTIWQIDHQKRLNRESRELAEVLYSDVEGEYQVHRASQADLYRLALEIEQLDIDYQKLLLQRSESRTRLNIIAGRPLNDTLFIVDEPQTPALPPFEELALRLAEHPDLVAMERMAEIQKAMADAAESTLNPTLMLRGGVAWMPGGHPVRTDNLSVMIGEFNRTGVSNGENFGVMIGGMLSLPFASWSRSGPEGKAADARLSAQQSLVERSTMLREMITKLRKPYGLIERATVMIEFYRDRQIPLLEQQIELLRSDYINNRADIQSLIETYRMLVITRDEVVQKEGERARAWGKIRELVGDEK